MEFGIQKKLQPNLVDFDVGSNSSDKIQKLDFNQSNGIPNGKIQYELILGEFSKLVTFCKIFAKLVT